MYTEERKCWTGALPRSLPRHPIPRRAAARLATRPAQPPRASRRERWSIVSPGRASAGLRPSQRFAASPEEVEVCFSSHLAPPRLACMPRARRHRRVLGRSSRWAPGSCAANDDDDDDKDDGAGRAKGEGRRAKGAGQRAKGAGGLDDGLPSFASRCGGSSGDVEPEAPLAPSSRLTYLRRALPLPSFLPTFLPTSTSSARAQSDDDDDDDDYELHAARCTHIHMHY